MLTRAELGPLSLPESLQWVKFDRMPDIPLLIPDTDRETYIKWVSELCRWLGPRYGITSLSDPARPGFLTLRLSRSYYDADGPIEGL